MDLKSQNKHKNVKKLRFCLFPGKSRKYSLTGTCIVNFLYTVCTTFHTSLYKPVVLIYMFHNSIVKKYILLTL